MDCERREGEGGVFSREQVDVEDYGEETGFFDGGVTDYTGEVFGYCDGGCGSRNQNL